MEKTYNIPKELLEESYTDRWDAGFAIVTQDSVGKTRYYTGYPDSMGGPLFSYCIRDSYVFITDREANRYLRDPLFERTSQLSTKPIHFIH